MNHFLKVGEVIATIPASSNSICHQLRSLLFGFIENIDTFLFTQTPRIISVSKFPSNLQYSLRRCRKIHLHYWFSVQKEQRQNCFCLSISLVFDVVAPVWSQLASIASKTAEHTQMPAYTMDDTLAVSAKCKPIHSPQSPANIIPKACSSLNCKSLW